MIYLPFFLQKRWQKLAWEIFKGAEIALAEHKGIIPLPEEIDNCLSNRIDQLKSRHIHLGIVLSDSDFISNINLDNFILLAPTQGRDFSSKTDIFQFFLCSWEDEMLGKILDDDLQIPLGERIILTDFPLNSDALKPFVGKIINSDNDMLNLPNLEALNSNKSKLVEKKGCYILIGFYSEGFSKWNVIERLREVLMDSFAKKTIITTSTFEDWRVLPHRRKSIAEGVLYTYPKLSKEADEVVERFEQEFGYKPNIYSLLIYDSVNVAIKSLIEAGPDYNAIKSYLTSHHFESAVWGEMGFTSEGVPYIIGKTPPQMFEIKFVDEKGEFNRR